MLLTFKAGVITSRSEVPEGIIGKGETELAESPSKGRGVEESMPL